MKKKDEEVEIFKNVEFEEYKDGEFKGFVLNEGMKFLAVAAFVVDFYQKSCEALETAEEKGNDKTEAYFMTLGAKLALEKVVGLIDAVMEDPEGDEEESEEKSDDVAKA